MGRRRRLRERGMLAPVDPPPSQLQHLPERYAANDDVANPGPAPATTGDKVWMLTLASLMAAVMTAWLGFLIWAAWRLLRPLLP